MDPASQRRIDDNWKDLNEIKNLNIKTKEWELCKTLSKLVKFMDGGKSDTETETSEELIKECIMVISNLEICEKMV